VEQLIAAPALVGHGNWGGHAKVRFVAEEKHIVSIERKRIGHPSIIRRRKPWGRPSFVASVEGGFLAGKRNVKTSLPIQKKVTGTRTRIFVTRQ